MTRRTFKIVEGPNEFVVVPRPEAGELNLNDTVWVRLTAAGQTMLQNQVEHWELFRQESGWWAFQLYELMHYFGASLPTHPGFNHEMVFENNLIRYTRP
jgi:hypothetical protein